jgi:hypothetical protein
MAVDAAGKVRAKLSAVQQEETGGMERHAASRTGSEREGGKGAVKKGGFTGGQTQGV